VTPPADADRLAERRIEELIALLETHPDSRACAAARELVALVLGLHGDGLGVLMGLLGGLPGGEAALARACAEPRIERLLLLHGLHPEPLESRVRGALEGLRAELGVLGVRIESMELDLDLVRLRLSRGRDGLSRPIPGLIGEIEGAVLDRAPELAGVEVLGLGETGSVSYVPLSALRRPGSAADRQGAGG
jgi:hypothetical protein